MAIYTRTGDTGTTALFGGKRVLKCEELVDVYGSIDELNSWVGLIKSKVKSQKSKVLLEMIQGDLFTTGSVLAGWKGDLSGFEKRLKEIEERIDKMEKELPVLTNFILPGGNELGSLTHVARSICRRVERQTVKLATQARQATRATQERPVVQEKDMNMIIQYLNRLSDLFFMLARFINKEENIEEVVWSGIRSKPS